VWLEKVTGLSLSSRLSEGVLWNFVGAVFTQGSVFLTNLVLARVLGKETFGEFAMIQSTLLTLTSVAQIATGFTVTKYVAEFRDVDKQRAGRVLGLCSMLTVATGLVASLLLVLGAPWLADHALNASHLYPQLMISASFVLFSVMNGYQIGALAGLERYRMISVGGAVLGGAHLAICWTATSLWSLEGAVGGLAVSALLRWVAYSSVLRRELDQHGITLRRREALQERDVLFKFALPAALSGLTTTPALWLGNAFLVRQVDGYSEMAIYTAANNFRIMVLFLPTLLNGVTSSILNNQRGQGDFEGYRSMFLLNVKATVLSASVGAIAMSLLGEWAMQAFGSDFVGANVRFVISFMALSVVLETVGIAVYQLISTHGHMWLSFAAIALPRDILTVVTAYWLTSQYGAAGLAGTYIVAFSFSLLVMVCISHQMRLFQLSNRIPARP
jgi:O-antigen/teichoic acid export membrane protein